MKKILIIRLGAIGDVVHSTIIPQSIKNTYPDVECHFLTVDFISSLIENSPYIDKIFKIDNKKKDNFFYLLSLGLKLRKEKYDAIINLTNSSRNIFLSLVANPSKIIKRSKSANTPVGAFFKTGEQVFDGLILPEALDLALSKEVEEKISSKIFSYKRPFIIFSPGGDNDKLRQGRIWDIEKWVELGKELQKKQECTIFVIGSKSEKEYHQKCQSIPNSVVFSGELSLEESASLSSLADLFISGDSGPLHIASGFNTKTLALLGSTNTQAYGKNAYKIGPNIDCKYCNQKQCPKLKTGEKITPCMQSIQVVDVVDFVDKNNLLN